MLSNNFLHKKKDGSQRVILNLKFLNETIDKVQFKMDLLKNAISTIFVHQMWMLVRECGIKMLISL